MNVIFTGIAGTRKARLAEKLAKYAAQKRFDAAHPPDLEEDHVKRYVQVHEVETKDNLETFFPIFLSTYNEDWKRGVWSQAINKVLNKMEPRPEHAFLLIHNYFMRDARVFSCVDWSALRQFRPNVFVSLIDDIFDSWQRIEDYEKEKMETRSHFELEELLLWRSLEITATSHLAQNLSDPPIDHYVMSVKHSVETFWHLLFNPEGRSIVYGCCPISKTRNFPSAREEIDRYHKELSSHFIAINPLTIDELRTKNNDDWKRLSADFSWFEDKRWPLPQEAPLGPPAVEPTPLTENPFEGLPPGRLLTVKEKIEGEIINRDFILISQAHSLLAYRPFFPEIAEGDQITKSGQISGGMDEEIIFALELKKPVYAFHPKCDHDPSQDQFFKDRGRYSQIIYFPRRHTWQDLPQDDFSGFPDLIDDLKRLF